MRKMRRRFLLFLTLFSVLLSSGCADRQPLSKSFMAMDTYLTFTIYGAGKQGEEILEQAKERVLELEAMLSVTKEGSDLSRINHSGGEAVEVSAETAELISFALSMAEETGGAVDPTIYPALTAWGFTTGAYQIPEDGELRQALSKVGYEKVSVDENRVSLPEGVMLDLGAFAKGFAGDLLAAELKEQGIKSAILDLGGNIQTIGRKPDGSLWKLGLKNPAGEGYVGVVTMGEGACVTSGNYERYFIGEDGQQYGHILDPASGSPVHNGLLSATVIAEQGREGDALSTALFVMGREKAESFWRERDDFEMILICEDGTILVSEGVADDFSLSEDVEDEYQIKVISRESGK